MKKTNLMAVMSAGLLALSLAATSHAQDFTAASQNSAPTTPGSTTLGPTDVANLSTVQAAGRRTGANGYHFCNVEGANNAAFQSYGAIRFDLTFVKTQLANHFGATPYTIKDVYLVMTQSNAAFSLGGAVNVFYTPDDVSPFGYTPPPGNGATWNATPVDSYTLSMTPAGEEQLQSYQWHKGGLAPDPATGANFNGTLDYIPLYGEVPADVPYDTTTDAPTTGPAVPAVYDATNNNGMNNLDLVNHIKLANSLTLTIHEGPNDPQVAATWEGNGLLPATTAPLYSPQIVIVAAPAPANPTISGTITFDSVAYPHTGGIPLDVVTLDYRTPGTTIVIFTQTVTPSSTDGSFAVVAPAAIGTFDLAFKGPKNLRVVIPNVNLAAGNATANPTLPGADADSNNTVDISDFGLLINAYGGIVSDPTSGYDPQADFNDDGTVDVGDFGILVNNYGSVGQ